MMDTYQNKSYSSTLYDLLVTKVSNKGMFV